MRKELFWLFIEYYFLTSSINLKEFMSSVEKEIIQKTLNKVKGNQRKAAKILGLKYRTLNEKVKRYQIHM